MLRTVLARAPRTLYRPLSTAASPLAAASPSSALVAERSSQRILSLFEKFGDSDYIGEPMSITEHSVQTAAAAAKGGESAEAQLSCLLHDVGHLLGIEAGNPMGMDGCGTEDHETIGAEFLGSLGFSDTVSYLARHHVNAKRYLCAKDPQYYDKLTEASKTTLKHQGGPMTPEECAEVEKDPRWPLVIRMRGYDEAGKDPSIKEKSPAEFLDDMKANILATLDADDKDKIWPKSQYASTYVLSSEQLEAWDRDGYLIVPNALPAETVAKLDSLSNEIAALPKSDANNGCPHPWLVHHERSKIDGSVNICRVENYCKHHAEWGNICFGIVQDLVSQAYREEAVLFKDKMNFKGPGGGNFLCHQDATAYSTENLASRHISVMVAIDASTPHNGPLQVTAGRHKEGVFKNAAGVTDPELEKDMEFHEVLTKPGDIVLFDSYLPHRSDNNMSDTWRRLAYLTFNPASEGDLHAQYYETKINMMKQGTAGSISINKDFGGEVL
jgi:predicted HD phosphohydrolase/ectoine hydroxylase-related dioxygenase (phytanoyl-CoA dioxygenase family)